MRNSQGHLAACRFFGLVVGLILSLVLISFLGSGAKTRFEDAAFSETDLYYGVSRGVPVHCKSVLDANDCLNNTRIREARSKYLWLGNSQLHAINQRVDGDRNAPELLHQRMEKIFGYVVTFSQANVNLQEQLVLFAYLQSRLRPVGLILPVVFDDFRESGIRGELLPALDDPVTRHALTDLEIGRAILTDARSTKNPNEDLAGLTNTVQEKSERFLTMWLSDRWGLWEARPEVRGRLFLALHRLRNTAFGIKATSVRRVIPGRFASNWSALNGVITLAEREGTYVFLYVVPLRNDVEMPYDRNEYSSFKARVVDEFANRPGIVVSNLENVVPNDLWGVKDSTALGGEPEYDFMHFQAKGHEALSDALFQVISGAASTAR